MKDRLEPDPLCPTIAVRKQRHRTRKSEKAQLTRRILHFYGQGLTQQEIADRLGVSIGTVNRHIQAGLEKWSVANCRDIDRRKAEELHRIDTLEFEATGAWLNSCKNAETIVKKRIIPPIPKPKEGEDPQPIDPEQFPVEETHTEKGQSGDPRFLLVRDSCIKQRCKILSIEATKIDHGGSVRFAKMSNEELIAFLQENPE